MEDFVSRFILPYRRDMLMLHNAIGQVKNYSSAVDRCRDLVQIWKDSIQHSDFVEMRD